MELLLKVLKVGEQAGVARLHKKRRRRRRARGALRTLRSCDNVWWVPSSLGRAHARARTALSGVRPQRHAAAAPRSADALPSHPWGLALAHPRPPCSLLAANSPSIHHSLQLLAAGRPSLSRWASTGCGPAPGKAPLTARCHPPKAHSLPRPAQARCDTPRASREVAAKRGERAYCCHALSRPFCGLARLFAIARMNEHRFSCFFKPYRGGIRTGDLLHTPLSPVSPSLRLHGRLAARSLMGVHVSAAIILIWGHHRAHGRSLHGAPTDGRVRRSAHCGLERGRRKLSAAVDMLSSLHDSHLCEWLYKVLLDL